MHLECDSQNSVPLNERAIDHPHAVRGERAGTPHNFPIPTGAATRRQWQLRHGLDGVEDRDKRDELPEQRRDREANHGRPRRPWSCQSEDGPAYYKALRIFDIDGALYVWNGDCPGGAKVDPNELGASLASKSPSTPVGKTVCREKC